MSGGFGKPASLLGQEFAMRVDAGEQSRRRKIIGKPPLGRR